jgi:hypothetical protein
MSALLRLLSVVFSLVLLISFGFFASDQAGAGSKKTVAQIAVNDNSDSTPTQAPAPAPKKKHNPVRTAIEKVNHQLVAPFSGIVATDSPWREHIAQTVLAFLVFGVGLGFLARYAATRGV